ncbi:MAG: hypothetical protein O3A93_00730 [Chloroflexi bacterium]|nr:hypothetical protein [Chloroflexota bacterium]MDA1269773.1 hypothetical protein [Chloroflexota bacterium]PKB59102.1 MAG: hypothetical protein BZY83_03770 [SAR202 cluster bacterium Casp-Chloro-G2]
MTGRAEDGPVTVSAPFKRGNETRLTYDLKMAAWEWLYREAGCRVIGLEVKLEGPGGRIVDLAAVGPQNTFYIVEVKSSRSDFSRDDHTAGDLSALRGREGVVTGRTDLAKETLSQALEYAKLQSPDAWREVPAFRQALADYRRVAGKEDAYRNRVSSFSTKFHDPRFMGIADFHYLISPKGVVTRGSLPPQWGLLDETSAVSLPAPRKETRKNTGIVANFLRAIARSNTTSMMRSQGMSFLRGEAASRSGI